MKRSEQIAEIAGEDAARDRQSSDDNPYPDGSARRSAWERGYYRQVAFIAENRKWLREYTKRQKAKQ